MRVRCITFIHLENKTVPRMRTLIAKQAAKFAISALVCVHGILRRAMQHSTAYASLQSYALSEC
jgi:hypothetical protein